MVSVLRPGYSPASEIEIGGNLLIKVYEVEQGNCSVNLKSQKMLI